MSFLRPKIDQSVRHILVFPCYKQWVYGAEFWYKNANISKINGDRGINEHVDRFVYTFLRFLQKRNEILQRVFKWGKKNPAASIYVFSLRQAQERMLLMLPFLCNCQNFDKSNQ